MAKLDKIVEFLDSELLSQNVEDSSNNGLQVENSGKVTGAVCGVDASLEFFTAARDRGADLLVCHHGISWGDSLKQITGINYRRLRFLLENDMALYACHLPLDMHPRYGNNARLAEAFNLQNCRPFGLHGGAMVGLAGNLDKPVNYAQFKETVRAVVGREPQTMDFAKQTVQTVAVVSGGAAEDTEEAARQGIDVYVSGEPALQAYVVARDYGINAIFAGHYATETFGVKALDEILKDRFGIKTEFIDLGIEY